MHKNLNELAEVVLEHGQFKFTKLGDYVECSISNQKIPIEELKYWNVDLQEAYFSHIEASAKKEKLNKNK